MRKRTTAIRKKDNLEEKIMLKSVYISRVIRARGEKAIGTRSGKVGEWGALEASSESGYMSILCCSWAIYFSEWVFKRGCIGAETGGDKFYHGDELQNLQLCLHIIMFQEISGVKTVGCQGNN